MLLNFTDTGQGPTIVLLHGMAGSLRYWEELIPELRKSHRVIAIDLLGFGQSPKPKDVTYTAETHLASIEETLHSIGISQPLTLVGHSTGALLALKLANRSPELVNRLFLFSLPIYKSPAEAKQDITRGGKLRELAYFGPTSRFLCTAWCKTLRPITRHLAPLYLKGLPKRVAQDSLLHTWQSYAQTLDQVVVHQDAKSDLVDIAAPTEVIYGDKESPIIANNFRNLKLSQNIRLQTISGRHNLAIDNKERVLEILKSRPR